MLQSRFPCAIHKSTSLSRSRSPLLPASLLISVAVYMRWFTSTGYQIPVEMGLPLRNPEACRPLSLRAHYIDEIPTNCGVFSTPRPQAYRIV